MGLFRRDRAYETSYKWLTRRGKEHDSLLARIVCRGPVWRRLVVFGALQFGYTVAAVLLVLPCYFSGWASWGLQAFKFLCALWHGSKYTVETVPRRMLRESMSQVELTQLVSTEQLLTETPQQQHQLEGEHVAAAETHKPRGTSVALRSPKRAKGAQVRFAMQDREAPVEVQPAASMPSGPVTRRRKREGL